MHAQFQLRLEQAVSANHVSNLIVYPFGLAGNTAAAAVGHLYAPAIEARLVVQGEVVIVTVGEVLSTAAVVADTTGAVGVAAAVAAMGTWMHGTQSRHR